MRVFKYWHTKHYHQLYFVIWESAIRTFLSLHFCRRGQAFQKGSRFHFTARHYQQNAVSTSLRLCSTSPFIFVSSVSRSSNATTTAV
jgi:hypothetical protein